MSRKLEIIVELEALNKLENPVIADFAIKVGGDLVIWNLTDDVKQQIISLLEDDKLAKKAKFEKDKADTIQALEDELFIILDEEKKAKL